jgi:hypothetical protein
MKHIATLTLLLIATLATAANAARHPPAWDLQNGLIDAQKAETVAPIAALPALRPTK